ncbi:MAG: hypothetical protein EOP33_02280 [Rickettsiaceae bacterium]|nr:MAG: hypothetical protein EOP33_02280 [Rickettsiaceae bacterium]
MNRTILSLLAGTALAFSATSFADTAIPADTTNTNVVTTQDAVVVKYDRTVMDCLKDLKDSLKDTAKTAIAKFSDKVSELYNRLSTQVDDAISTSQDSKDVRIEQLKQERDAFKVELDKYNKADDVKTEEMRRNLVKKLEELNDKVNDYNKSIKK